MLFNNASTSVRFDPESYIKNTQEGKKQDEGEGFLKSIQAYQERNEKLLKYAILEDKPVSKSLLNRKVEVIDGGEKNDSILEYAKTVVKTPLSEIQSAEHELLETVQKKSVKEFSKSLDNLLNTLAKNISSEKDEYKVKKFLDDEKKDFMELVVKENPVGIELKDFLNEFEAKMDGFFIKQKAFKTLQRKYSSVTDTLFLSANTIINEELAKKVCEGDEKALQTMTAVIMPLLTRNIKQIPGLKNIRNLCFINSSIQAIRHGFSEHLLQEFSKEDSADNHEDGPSTAFLKLNEALESPEVNRTLISRKHEEFIQKCKLYEQDGIKPFAQLLRDSYKGDLKKSTDYVSLHKIQQQDAQEFMLPLIKMLGKSHESEFSLQSRPIYTVKIKDKNVNADERPDSPDSGFQDDINLSDVDIDLDSTDLQKTEENKTSSEDAKQISSSSLNATMQDNKNENRTLSEADSKLSHADNTVDEKDAPETTGSPNDSVKKDEISTSSKTSEVTETLTDIEGKKDEGNDPKITVSSQDAPKQDEVNTKTETETKTEAITETETETATETATETKTLEIDAILTDVEEKLVEKHEPKTKLSSQQPVKQENKNTNDTTLDASLLKTVNSSQNTGNEDEISGSSSSKVVQDEQNSQEDLSKSVNLSIAKNIQKIDAASLILPLQFPQDKPSVTLQDLIEFYTKDEVLEGFKITKDHFDQQEYEVKTNQTESGKEMSITLKNQVLEQPQQNLEISKRVSFVADSTQLKNVVLQLAMFDFDMQTLRPSKLVTKAQSVLGSLKEKVVIPVTDKTSGQVKELPFRVKSICLHQGRKLENGHYVTAQSLDHGGDTWRLHDDDRVSDINWRDLARGKYGEPYIVICERADL